MNHTVRCPNHKNYSVPCHGKSGRNYFQLSGGFFVASMTELISNSVFNNIQCEAMSLVSCVFHLGQAQKKVYCRKNDGSCEELFPLPTELER
jgi:hypothetical protein